VQLAASIVVTSHHRLDVAPAPPSPVGGGLPLELALLDDDPVGALPFDELAGELPLDPEGTMLEPELGAAGDPCTTITFSGGAAEHAAARATVQTPNLNWALMSGEVPRHSAGQASDHA
jgi:hypothetical protein